MVNYLRSQAVADRQIRKYGALAYLRRDSVDRECYALEVQISAHERNALKNPTDRVFIVSAVGLAVPPTKDDSLVVVDEASGTKLPPFRLSAPPAPLQPKPGGLVIYYELQVQK
jgi:hypothetical protein